MYKKCAYKGSHPVSMPRVLEHTTLTSIWYNSRGSVERQGRSMGTNSGPLAVAEGRGGGPYGGKTRHHKAPTKNISTYQYQTLALYTNAKMF